MSKLNIISSLEVKKVFDAYPKNVKPKILNLRALIIDSTDELGNIYELVETLKWGEPSYLTKKGSTIRIDWKTKTPDYYAMYFKCTSKLIPTFRKAFPNIFNFSGTRAIIFDINDKIPKIELKKCIKAGLQYHTIKKLPHLGLSMPDVALST